MLSIEVIEERFWQKVLVKPGEDDCWFWVGATGRDGYGNLHLGFDAAKRRITKPAHIVSWLLEYGVWPAKCVLHSCDVHRCVRPKHLWEGTYKENTADMHAKGRGFDPSKISEAEVEYIREMRGKMLQKELADALGVSRATICRTQLGRNH